MDQTFSLKKERETAQKITVFVPKKSSFLLQERQFAKSCLFHAYTGRGMGGVSWENARGPGSWYSHASWPCFGRRMLRAGTPTRLRARTPLPARPPPPLLHLFGKGQGQRVPARDGGAGLWLSWAVGGLAVGIPRARSPQRAGTPCLSWHLISPCQMFLGVPKKIEGTAAARLGSTLPWTLFPPSVRSVFRGGRGACSFFTLEGTRSTEAARTTRWTCEDDQTF